MARLPRFFVPDLPLHVVARGNNRAPIFGGRADLAFYRSCLAYAARRCEVAIHAYVFMTNHVHLLVTPTRATSLARMMQSIGRVYVQYFNACHERTGTLWEGRYKAAIVDDERYLLTCMRYVELFGPPIANHEIEIIRDATQNAWALGDAAFRQRILASGRRPARLPRGGARPHTHGYDRADPPIDAGAIAANRAWSIESDPIEGSRSRYAGRHRR